MLTVAFLCALLSCTYGSDRAQERAPAPPCLQPSIMNRRIIDVNASKAAGAVFIGSVQPPQPPLTCADACCAVPGCNMAVYRPDEEGAVSPSEKGPQRNQCYLFNCQSPSVCTVAEHSLYNVAIVDRTHPPAAVASTPASSRKVAFLGSCHLGDQCEGINTECSAGMCMCKENYHHKNDVCRERCDPVTSYECVNGGIEYSGPDCIAVYDVCNGIPECADGSDEVDCAAGHVLPNATTSAATGSAARTSAAMGSQLVLAASDKQQLSAQPQHGAASADASSMMRSHSAHAPSPAAAGQQQLHGQRLPTSAAAASAAGSNAAFVAADLESDLDEALAPIPHSARRPAQSPISRSGRRPPAAAAAAILPGVGLRSRPQASYYPPAGQPDDYPDDVYDYDRGGGGGGDYRRVLLDGLLPEEAGLVDSERVLANDFASDRRLALLRKPVQQQQQPHFRKLADVYTPYRELLPAVRPVTGDRKEKEELAAPEQYAYVDALNGRTWGSKSRARLPSAAAEAANQEGSYAYRPQLADPNEEWLTDHSRKTGNLGDAGPDIEQNDLSKGPQQQGSFKVQLSSTPPDPTATALSDAGGARSHDVAKLVPAAVQRSDAPSTAAAMQPSAVAVVASNEQQLAPISAASEPPQASTPHGGSGDGAVPLAAGGGNGLAVPAAAAGQLDTSWAAAQHGSAVAALVLGTLLAVALAAYGVRRCIVGASPGNLVHRVKAMGWGSSKPDADYLINGMYL